ncbi:MAG: ATP-binding cassette domain-containing protein, partial [Bacilli bacterium]|nr:ATP-binding cassette domain-containing protein [Bacilli bacterium]
MNIINIKNMSYSYSSIKVLDNVSFSIEENAINSIIGPSGSGKSTIVKILTGLLKTDAEIDISFMKMDKKNLYEIRKKIGVVFENPDNQFVADTVIDDIAFSLENMNYKNDIIMKKIKHIAKLLDMEYLLYREPAKLSGGEKELVAIAGALAHDPKVLILDEALTMLDCNKKIKVLEVLKKLTKEGLTIINITHDSEELLYSDKIILLNKGKVIKTGTKDDIFKD